MGIQAKQTKDRICKTCQVTFNVTAKELKRHVIWCEQAKNISDRMSAIGLVNPNLVVTYPDRN